MTDTAQSREQRALFDIIDKLRSQGISKYVDLPEIIVCGDQSSGKSSVLEAISGMSFPTKDNLCTRFATELILRRTHDTTSCTISIIPDAERPEGEKAELKRFDKTIDSHELNLGKAVEDAKGAMGLTETKRFSNDILRVELCGPDQPHLTMVDLPGLFSASDKDQSNEDAKTVKRMVLRHMERDRSIILAVISAKNDFANQQVTRLTRRIDPQGNRTMGLITKPDTLHRGSESEAFYIDLAKNRNVKFRLGWHMLRNRDYPERSSSSGERDATEQLLFEQYPYTSLEKNQLGVTSLKPRLSEILLEQILFQLPGLQADVEVGIRDCESQLQRMGSARNSLREQKRYLFGVSDGFTRLMEHAVQGTYGDLFFGDAMDEDGMAKRLRAVVQNRFLTFASVMRDDGRTRNIIDTEEDGEEVDPQNEITRKDYIEEVNELMSRSRGKELPGTFNPIIIRELFAKQCTKWRDFTFSCLEDILHATEELVDNILEKVAVAQTQIAIRNKINAGMEAIKVELRAKTEEILVNHINGHPMTYNHYLADEVEKIQSERRAKELEDIMVRVFGATWNVRVPKNCIPKDVFNAIRNHSEESVENYASSLAVDYAEAYFKIASKRFVDDLADLSVERCLMVKVSGLFSREIIDEMEDDEIHDIAKESPEAAGIRVRYTAKLDALRAGLGDLKRLDRHRMRKLRSGAIAETSLQNGHLASRSDTESEPEAPSSDEEPEPEELSAGTDGEPSAARENGLTRAEQRRLKRAFRSKHQFEQTADPVMVEERRSPKPVYIFD